MSRLRVVLGMSLVLAGCSSPNFANPGENFAQYEIEALIDGLASEFDRAEYSSGFRAEGRLSEGWVSRVRNWEAAKRALLLKVNVLKNENLSRSVSFVLVRPMLGPGGNQRLRDLRAAQMKIDMVERIYDTLTE